MENRYLKMDIKHTATIKIKRLKIESTLIQLKINIRKKIRKRNNTIENRYKNK